MTAWWLLGLIPLGCWWRASGDPNIRAYFNQQTRHRRNR